jgi:glycosyltransferase involved in cell wall biosynthesis
MRITIDARSIRTPVHGIGRYTAVLLHGLAQVAPDLPLNVLVDGADGADALIPGLCRSPGVSWRWVKADFPVNSVAKNMLLLPRLLRRLSTGVFHTPDTYCLPRGPYRSVVTLHDVIPLTHRQYLGGLKARHAWLWRRWLIATASRASAVVTVSDVSRQEIHRELGTDLSKIHRIYNGVVGPTLPEGQLLQLPPALGAIEPFLLYVGRHDPYKNLCGMILAFEKFLREAGGNWNFVIAGPPDARYQEPQNLAKRLGLESRVHFAGYVGDDVLDLLYRRARVLMLPSLMEGFGLPMIEAMIRGTPVLTSRNGATAEIAQGAAALVDPACVDSIVQGLKNVLLDPDNAMKLAQAGRIRASEFTPQRMAQQHLELYQSLMR